MSAVATGPQLPRPPGPGLVQALWFVWGALNVVLGALLAYEGLHHAAAAFLCMGAAALAVAGWVLT